MEAIDLTRSDSEEDVRQSKRQRRSSPDDDVQIIEKPGKPTPAATGPEPTLGDGDLLITNATGPVWNHDLPHTRTQCGKHPFVLRKTPSNSQHCGKCFCYICDVEADKCQQWGSGHSSKDHCNAHSEHSFYRDMRTRARTVAASPSNPVTSPRAALPSRAPAPGSRRQGNGPVSAAGASTVVQQGAGSASRGPHPHDRAQCVLHPFRHTPSTANQARCIQCLCYVCNEPAATCQLWGTGAAYGDHCNAHSGLEAYTLARGRSQAGKMAAAAALAAPAGPPQLPFPPQFGFPGAYAEEDEDEEENEDEMYEHERYGTAYWDEEDEENAYEEDEDGEEEMAAMYAQMGGYRRRPLPRDWAQPSQLSRAARPPRQKQPMQPLEPSLVMPDPALNPNMLELGTIELPIRAEAPYTVADLQERLVPTGIYHSWQQSFCRHSTRLTINSILSSDMVEVLPLPLLEHGCEPTPMRVRRVTIVSTDGSRKPLTVGVSVHKAAKVSELLDALMQHPAAACSPHEELMLGHGSGEQCPTARSTLIRDLSTSFPFYQAKHGLVAYRVQRTNPPVAIPGHPLKPFRAMVVSKKSNTEGSWPEFLETAHALLLNLPTDQTWQGGPEADKMMATMIAGALAPYRLPNAPNYPLNQCFTLLRCSSSGYPIYGSRKNFATQLDSIFESSECHKNGMLYLCAQWKAHGLEVYDTEAWSKSEVHESASQAVMAETERLIKEEEKTIARKWEREQLPKDVLNQLSEQSTNYRADQIKQAQVSQRPLKPPAAACKLFIRPEPEADGDRAILAIHVFVWTSRGTFNKEFFKLPSDWVEPNAKVRNRHVEPSDCHLNLVMDFLLRDDPQVKAMKEEMKACEEKMHGTRPFGVTALMKWLEAGERSEAPQPPGLMVQLRPYQRQSLRFMIDSENGEGGHRRHFWVRYSTPSGFTFWWSPLFSRACREVAPCPWGGFLAEEMGCGKTVEILGLILANPAPPNITSGSQTPNGLFRSRATLVVCAVSLVGQWMAEANSKLNGSLRMYQYHGQGRNRDALTLATSYDLVVTTYQTLGSDWRTYTKKGGNTDGRFTPLGQVQWHRVVLDESHTVKAGGAQQAMACCALKADRRWCCSGTPISTDVSEFLGQFNFLGCQPFCWKNFFNAHVKPSWAKTEWCAHGGAVSLVYALGRTAIRHTQQQRLGGVTVCELPQKIEDTIAVEFTEEEQRLYMRVHKDAKAEFNRYASLGPIYVARNLLAIMSLLSPLRAICSGGVLRERDVTVPNREAEQEVPFGVDPNLVAPLEECSICLNVDMERPCRTPCQHWFCRECIMAELTVREKCPLCRSNLQAAQLVEGVAANRGEDDDAAEVSTSASVTMLESKLQMLLSELSAMRQKDPTAKALIFTQFSSTLEWLMSRLTEEGYGYRTISGSMPMKKRSEAIEAFQRDPPTTVFLLSMRSGAVGINLTAANHVFILEPAMNPALEDQAVGRAFRMGQARPVIVKKLYIKGSVEERIMELVKNRREGTAMGAAGGAAAAANREYDEHRRAVRNGKMKQQDVAGSIAMDRQNLRMAELQRLFQDPVFGSAAGLQQAAAAYNAAPAPAACGVR